MTTSEVKMFTSKTSIISKGNFANSRNVRVFVLSRFLKKKFPNLEENLSFFFSTEVKAWAEEKRYFINLLMNRWNYIVIPFVIGCFYLKCTKY